MAFRPYFTFNGNCREAMKFYQSCFGGELNFRMLNAPPFPQDVHSLVLQGVLTSETIQIYGTDLSPEELVPGNQISMLVKTQGRDELEDLQRLLSSGRVQNSNRTSDIPAGQLVSVTDKFGINWLIYF